jgi:hypothetical protein
MRGRDPSEPVRRYERVHAAHQSAGSPDEQPGKAQDLGVISRILFRLERGVSP